MSWLDRLAPRIDDDWFRREFDDMNRQLRQLAPPRRGALAASVNRPRRARGGIVSGAVVIRSNGLPDGFEPPSTSVSLGVTGEMAGLRMAAAMGGCQHADAEPVELCTGEVVAAVCPSCWRSLPAEWVGSDWKP